MYVTRKGRGMGDIGCQVGALDPATGDTIAGCLGGGSATISWPVGTDASGNTYAPVLSQSMTVTAKAYPTWLYVGAAVLGSVFLLKLVKS
jgi:hypothetical protein